MGKLNESAVWEPDIYQIETSDPVMGGPNGISNKQGGQLGNRTQWLKAELAKAVADIGTNKADKSVTLTAGTGLTGGGTLAANRTFAVDFATAAETKIGTINNKAISPAAIAGNAFYHVHSRYDGSLSSGDANDFEIGTRYLCSNAVTNTPNLSAWWDGTYSFIETRYSNGGGQKVQIAWGYDKPNVATRTFLASGWSPWRSVMGADWTSTASDGIRNKPTTVAGYGITDVFNQAQINGFLAAKANNTVTITGGTGLKGGGAITGPQSLTIDKATAADLAAGTNNKVITADIAKVEFDKQVPYTGATSNLDLNNKELVNVGAVKIGNGNVVDYRTVMFGNYNRVTGAGNYFTLHNGNFADNERCLGISTYSETNVHIASIYATSVAPYYRQGESNFAIALKKDVAMKSTSLAGYGITNAYTSLQTDNLLSNKVDKSVSVSTGTGLIGGGALSASLNISIDKATTQNVNSGTGDKVITADILLPFLAARVPEGRAITTGTGLTGGGDLTANRTLSIDKASAADLINGTANKVLTTETAKAEFDKQVSYVGAKKPVDLNGQNLSNVGNLALGDGNNSSYQAMQLGNWKKAATGENFSVFHNARYKNGTLLRYAAMTTFDAGGAEISTLWSDEVGAYLRLSNSVNNKIFSTLDKASAAHINAGTVDKVVTADVLKPALEATLTALRLGAEVSATQELTGTYKMPVAHVMTGYNVGLSSGSRTISGHYSRPVQVQINGDWRTVAVL